MATASQTLPPPPSPPPSGVPLAVAVGMAAAAAGLAATVSTWWKSGVGDNSEGVQRDGTTTSASASETVATEPTTSVASDPTAGVPKLAIGVMDGRDAELMRVAPISGKTATPDGIDVVIFHGGCPGTLQEMWW
jgi:hypothetical protein